MRKKINKILAAVIMAFALVAPVVSVNSTMAAPVDDVCDGVALTGGTCDPATGGGGLDNVIAKAVTILSVIIGVISVIMIMIGGLKYITSGGDANNITSAKNTILYAIIGLVVVALAQIIVKFVIAKVKQAT